MTPDLPGSDQTFKIPHDHLEEALGQVTLGFWEVNLVNSNFMSCTEQCKRNFGWDITQPFSYEDMLGCILPEDRPAMQENVMRAIRERQNYLAQYRIKHPDGSIHWIQAQGKVICENNEPVKIAGTTIDITDKKDLETLRDELLSVTMHELKTPLSAVKGSLQLLERHLQKNGDEKILKIASRALGSADRITRLLNDMASPMMQQSSEIVLQKVAFDLRRLADEIAENAGMLNGGYEVIVHTPDSAVMVQADRHRIAQVLTNLVNNAIKYSPGGSKVEITISPDVEDVTVRVKDYGMGIAHQDRHKIFQKFYRSNVQKSIGGLGIGLFLCAEIILRHGGRIAIEDTIGPGSTVFFSLPTADISN